MEPESQNLHNLLFVVFILVLSSLTAFAGAPQDDSQPKEKSFINFSDTRMLYLYGANWNLGHSNRDIITFEHFNNNSIGDYFMFIDVANLVTRGTPQPQTTFYCEMNPRISLSKLFDEKVSYGFVKDVLYASTYELASNANGDSFRHLHGIGLSLDVPGFYMTEVNFYRRDNVDVDGATWQMTVAWGSRFDFGSVPLHFSGYLDWAGAEGHLENNVGSSVRLLMDIGSYFGYRQDQFLLGTEISYWYNEFGIKGKDEFVPQLAFQIRF